MSFVEVGDTNVAYLQLGPSDGPLAMCLHGFPDSAATWRHLLPRLAAAGYRAVAPWLPGYAPTVAPAHDRLHPGQLAAHVNALHDALRADDRAVLIGHDWGAIITDEAASRAHNIGPDGTPLRWHRTVTLSVAPTASMPTVDLRQARLSAYAMVFAMPGGVRRLQRRDMAFADELWARWSPAYTVEDIDRAGWREAFSPDGGHTAIAYYRGMMSALIRRQWPDSHEGCSAVPSLHLVGEFDGCINAANAPRALDLLAEGSQVEVLDGAGHFFHLEQPEEIGDRIMAFLGPADPSDAPTSQEQA